MLFRRKIEPNCGYCHSGTSIGRGEVACTKRGIMASDGRCSSFRYEPTKREPEFTRNPGIVGADITAEDFAIS